MKTLTLLTCTALMSVGASADSLNDSLKFKLDLRDPGFISTGNFGNALDMDGAGSFVGFANNNESQTAQVRVETVDSKVYPWQSEQVPVLYLPQHSKPNASDPSKYDTSATRLTIPWASPINAQSQTAFVRFRWDGQSIPNQDCWCWIGGNSYDWNNRLGWVLYLQSYANKDYAYPGVFVGRQSMAIGWDIGGGKHLTVEKGKWYDMFVQFAPVAGSNQTRVYWHLYATPGTDGEGYLKASAVSGWTDVNATLAFGESGSVFVGAEYGGAWYSSPSSPNESTAKCFRGSIAQFQIYSKTLTDVERCEVMAGTHGSTWEIGVANGSAAEFNATEPLDVVTPKTRWSQVRRELTESHPTVTIRDTMIARESGMNKILEINPLVSGNGPFNVEVRVNGTKVAAEELSVSRSIAIPGSAWQADNDGNVTVSITRVAPFDGTLALDAVKLCGGWAIGGTMDMMTRENNVIPWHFIGQTDSKTMQRSSQNNPANTIYFHVPQSALGNFRYRFKAVVEGRSATTDVPKFAINGHVFSDFKSVDYNDVLEVEIPGDFLVAGKNELKISNAGWTSYKSFSISEKPKMGMVLIFR